MINARRWTRGGSAASNSSQSQRACGFYSHGSTLTQEPANSTATTEYSVNRNTRFDVTRGLNSSSRSPFSASGVRTVFMGRISVIKRNCTGLHENFLSRATLLSSMVAKSGTLIRITSITCSEANDACEIIDESACRDGPQRRIACCP